MVDLLKWLGSRRPNLRFIMLLSVYISSAFSQNATDCASCPSIYQPVVDIATGLPFYNACLAKCQLGSGAFLQPADAVQTPKSGGRPLAEGAAEVINILPPPTPGGQGPPVTRAVMRRYQAEGYVYVGRPGRPGAAAGKGPSTGKKTKDEGNTNVGLNSTADDEPDATYFIRYTYDTGDVYMRAVSKAAMEESVADALDPTSGLGGLAGPRRPSANPAPPSKGRDIMAGWNVSDGPDLPSMGRRLLQQQQGIVGVDNRTQISTAPVYPYSAVAYIRIDTSYACSGAVVGSDGRVVLTAAHCIYNAEEKFFYQSFIVFPGLYVDADGVRQRPYFYQNATAGEVRAEYRKQRKAAKRWQLDTGVLLLPAASRGGALGFGYTCGETNYALTTAGYANDKPLGSMWTQQAPCTADVCGGMADTLCPLDVVKGMSGSAVWTASGKPRNPTITVRFVVSFTAQANLNGVTAITPAAYAWILDFAAAGTGKKRFRGKGSVG